MTIKPRHDIYDYLATEDPAGSFPPTILYLEKQESLGNKFLNKENTRAIDLPKLFEAAGLSGVMISKDVFLSACEVLLQKHEEMKNNDQVRNR